MDEFALIRQYFTPLSRGFDGGLSLSDDAAILPSIPGCDLVVTKDALSEGVHFLGSESPDLMAKKALRVNLSDLAAMGATPLAYFLAIMLPRHVESSWVAEFARGLNEDQELFSVYLAGGDTISTQNSLTFSITAIGRVPTGKALRRSHAQPGDIIYCTGTLGDSALGLQLLQRNIAASISDAVQQFLQQRYYIPEPRLEIGKLLSGHVNGCMDISDGLLQDISHICRASNVAAIIDKEHLPLSHAAQSLIAQNANLWPAIYSGGDDYELLFTAPADQQEAIETIADKTNTPITSIGRIEEGSGVTLMDAGQPIAIDKAGFNHFSQK